MKTNKEDLLNTNWKTSYNLPLFSTKDFNNLFGAKLTKIQRDKPNRPNKETEPNGVSTN